MTKLTRAYVTKEVHRHNSFSGVVRMAEINMRRIIYSSTASGTAKAYAQEIEFLLGKLRQELKTRIDP